MKIILSPSKLQSAKSIYATHNKIISYNKTKCLKNKLKNMRFEELKDFFGLKGEMVDKLYHQLHSNDSKKGDAIATYTGIVFREINSASYDACQLEYLLLHGVVLSAMYGLLEPNMLIEPYRLDMTKSLGDINLYHYWQSEIDHYFKDVDLVINLASIEFSKMLKNYRGRMVNLYFKEEQSNGQLKIVTVRTKQARGLMFDYMVTHCITDLDQLKYFSEVGYHYAEHLSDSNNLYFIKQFEQ